MNGQIQYGPARPMTFDATPARRGPRIADPARFGGAPHMTRSLGLLVFGAVALGGLLVAVPRQAPGIMVATAVGGAWLSLVLAMTLPSKAERAGEELARRLGRFRHAVNAVGDAPTRQQLDGLLALARELELREQEIADEFAQIRAALEAVTLRDQIARGYLPVVGEVTALAPGDECHFSGPVRFGRRRSDQFGRLLLTSGWLKYRGALDVSVAWSEVSDVQRAGKDVIVSLRDSQRALRFACQEIEQAARAGVIAEHLARAARADDPPQTAPLCQAAM